MKYLLMMVVLPMCSSLAWANCEAQLKTLRDDMNAGNYSLDVRRKVNDRLLPVLQPRNDLNPISEAECKREMQAARDILAGTDVKIAKK
jgi:hypothetical protein